MPTLRDDVWLPTGDRRIKDGFAIGTKLNGHTTVQFDMFVRCLPFAPSTGIACDIGADVGLWSRTLANVFSRVVAFEPDGQKAQCLRKNCHTVGNVSVHEFLPDDGEYRLDRLRPFRSRSKTLDFVRLAEGVDRSAIVGMERTIKQCEPVILVHASDDIVSLLCDWGMTERWRQSDASFLVW